MSNGIALIKVPQLNAIPNHWRVDVYDYRLGYPVVKLFRTKRQAEYYINKLTKGDDK